MHSLIGPASAALALAFAAIPTSPKHKGCRSRTLAVVRNLRAPMQHPSPERTEARSEALEAMAVRCAVCRLCRGIA